MEATKLMIHQVFTSSRLFEMPFFQRAYVWDEPQRERLLEDVESVSRGEGDYFMGSIVLKQKPTNTSNRIGDVRTVIDGQQRLTTISVLLKALSLKTGQIPKFDRRFRLDDGTPVIQHNHDDAAAFAEVMDREEAAPLGQDGAGALTRAFNWFVERLKPDKVNFEAVMNRIMLVVIELAVEEDEQEIFNTLNSLGVRLTTAELLKNHLFGLDDVTAYENTWKDIFEKDKETREYWDREIVTGRLRRSFSDIFFHAYLHILANDQELPVKSDDKIMYFRVDKLFDSWKHFVKEYMTGRRECLLDGIRRYARSFKASFDPNILAAELPGTPGLERMNALIFGMETTSLIPYALFVENHIGDEAEKKGLYKLLETYLVRRAVCKATSKGYNRLFGASLILNRVLSVQDFLENAAKQEEQNLRMPGDGEFREAFHKNTLTNKQAAGILYLMETTIRDHSKHSTLLRGMDQYSLEHLLPKKWRKHWPGVKTKLLETERDNHLLTLGNLAIITQKLNASVSEACWTIKLERGLRKYAGAMDTLAGFLDRVDWDETAIYERADWLASKALGIWTQGPVMDD